MNRERLLQLLGILTFLTQTAYSQVGIGTTTPTAQLEITAGTAAIAPLKLNMGTNLATPESGAVEFDGTNYFATSGGIRYTLAKILTGSVTTNFSTLNNDDSDPLTVTISVPGAQVGDPVIIGFPNNVMDSNTERKANYEAWVSSADTVTIKFSNPTDNSINPDSATFRVSVLRY